MACCGRANNRASKGGGAAGYYARYAFLSSHKRAKQAELVGSRCDTCDALTVGDPCSICGKSKSKEKEQIEGA